MIKPALTAEEWAGFLGGRREVRRPSEGALNGVSISYDWPWTGLNIGAEHSNAGLSKEWSHTIAAVALWDEPFGFTREDVKKLIRVMEGLEWEAPFTMAESDELEKWAGDFQSRIEALLPPEKP